ncbi:MAG: hypothetical protein JWN21_1059, partial [Sphingomonas bacterium]|nr:hypothetical protein [Sphingomonas bacterium]
CAPPRTTPPPASPRAATRPSPPAHPPARAAAATGNRRGTGGRDDPRPCFYPAAHRDARENGAVRQRIVSVSAPRHDQPHPGPARPALRPAPLRPRATRHRGPRRQAGLSKVILCWVPSTSERQLALIEALADTGSVTSAARQVNMTPENAYQLRRHPAASPARRPCSRRDARLAPGLLTQSAPWPLCANHHPPSATPR